MINHRKVKVSGGFGHACSRRLYQVTNNRGAIPARVLARGGARFIRAGITYVIRSSGSILNAAGVDVWAGQIMHHFIHVGRSGAARDVGPQA